MANALREITIDMTQQKTDIDTMEATVANLRAEMSKMFEEMQRLDGMWKGRANNAFRNQFLLDHKNMETVCEVLDELIASLRNANQEYVTCEAAVSSLVDSIRI